MTRNNADFQGGGGNVFINANHGEVLRLSPRDILKHAVMSDVYTSDGEHLPEREQQASRLTRFLGKKVKESELGKSRATKEEQSIWEKYGQTGWSGGLYQSIRDKGYDETKPILVSYDKTNPYWKEPYIEDGNHRLAVSHALNPDTPIPVRVIHHD
jgi:hypothetical protein